MPATYGSAGVGSSTHLGCEMLGQALGVKLTHVPYRGMGPVMQDLTAGRIDFGCDFVLGALPQIEGKTIKPIAVLTKDRSSALPNVATAQEQGLAGFEAYNWNAYFLPKGTPDPIVRRLHAALTATLESPAVRERLLSLGAVIPAPRAPHARIPRRASSRARSRNGRRRSRRPEPRSSRGAGAGVVEP